MVSGESRTGLPDHKVDFTNVLPYFSYFMGVFRGSLLMIIRGGDLINVHELSRLARNTQDLLKLVDTILTKGASIKFFKENLFFDANKKNDAFQSLMLTMLGAISQFERDLMLERQREGIAIAKDKGKYKGRPSSFTNEELEKIRNEFDGSTNKADLARKWNISRGYLYQLANRNAENFV